MKLNTMNEFINLDLSSFKNALHSLNEAVIALANQPENLFVRDATIQRFEYTYELSHKMLKRYLEMTEANIEIIDQMSFSTLIRTGAEKGLLQHSWDLWSSYRAARNLTSHTYNEAKAIEVCQIIPKFLQEAEFLRDQLQKRIGK
jgi:nucleotidyltransferase substrate binding protein (TIGR01987 family)